MREALQMYNNIIKVIAAVAVNDMTNHEGYRQKI